MEFDVVIAIISLMVIAIMVAVKMYFNAKMFRIEQSKSDAKNIMEPTWHRDILLINPHVIGAISGRSKEIEVRFRATQKII